MDSERQRELAGFWKGLRGLLQRVSTISISLSNTDMYTHREVCTYRHKHTDTYTHSRIRVHTHTEFSKICSFQK